MANLRVDKITSTETFEKTGSVQFDGTTDFLSLSSNTDFAMGTGDFTVECWVYVVKQTHVEGGYGQRIFDSNTGQLSIYINSDGTGGYVGALVSGTDIRPTVSHGIAPEGTWTHAAICRSGDDFRIFVNGKEAAHRSGTGSVASSADFRIGARASGEGGFKGHISNLRVIKGQALYTENFKPPMRELEVTPETVLLACQSKTDASLEKTGKTITVTGNAVASELTPGILTPVVKSGGGSAITGSVEFTSTTDALVLSAGEDFAYGTGDFTIEAWIQPQGKPNGETKAIFTQSQSGNDYIIFKVDSDKAIKATFGSTTVSGGTVEVGSWHHVAVTRASNTVKIFVNGVASAGTTVSTDFSDTTRNPTIGQYTHAYGSIEYYGFISNFRINKGTALYTDDFIPPTKELKKVPGTVLLCCQDPDSPLTEATGKTITGYGDLRRTDGSELVTNGDFSNGTTGWTISDSGEGSMAVVSGQLVVTNNDTSDPPVYAWQQITTAAGNRYRVEFQLAGGTSSSHAIYLNSASSFGGAYGQRATSGTNPLTVGALGELEFVAAGTSAYILLRVNSNSSATSIFDNISAYAIPHDADAPASNFTPQVGDDRKVTFEGVTKIDTDAYFYLPTGNTESRTLNVATQASSSARGLFAGGYNYGNPAGSRPTSNVIDYITISSTGDALDFGDLTESRGPSGGVASPTRGVWMRGDKTASPYRSDTIDYVTISSKGNAQDFGNTIGTHGHGNGNVSDSTRGICAGGNGNPAVVNNIEYITIATTGNGQDFGDLTVARYGMTAVSSPTRGVFSPGDKGPAFSNTMDYITIQSMGNALDFGDGISSTSGIGAASNSIRGIFGNGYVSPYQKIDYITIASTGNAQSFGDLGTDNSRFKTGTSSPTRAVFAGGYAGAPTYLGRNDIEYVTIMSLGNAVDFGNLTSSRGMAGGCSNGHGGLG